MRRIHGHSRPKSRTYIIWASMKARCSRRNHRYYKDYGGRGIFVCERWLTFANFLEDMGVAPDNLTLDRKDNNGQYCKENCRWATDIEQKNNRRDNFRLTHNGVTMAVCDWARIVGMNPRTLKQRVQAGWSSDDALFRPVRVWKNARDAGGGKGEPE